MIYRLKYMDQDGEFEFKDFQTKQELEIFIENNNLRNNWHEIEQQSMIPSKKDSDFNKGKNVL